MTDHTTIQITTEQADQLRERRQYDDEPYKSVIARLLAGTNSAINTDELAAALADELDTPAGGSDVDDSEIADAVAERIDYADISTRVARDVREALK